MLARLGFVASVLSENLSTSRTCRLRNATPERLREITAQNLAELDQVLTFLERERIRLYRITSNLIPFASHAINPGTWRTDHAQALAQLGRRIRELGVRVSTHPGQYTVLNSPHPAIVAAATSELVYHEQLLEALGTDTSSKIVVHVGGLYGSEKAAAIGRFVARAAELPPGVLRRLVVENDDRLFDAEDALSAGRALGIPIVFDWLHHQANPCRRRIEDVLADIFATWRAADGRPKIHLSSQIPKAQPGAHADYVRPNDLRRFLEVAPNVPFDCMLEAKAKDRALLRLRQELRRAGILESDLGQPAPRGGRSGSRGAIQ